MSGIFDWLSPKSDLGSIAQEHLRDVLRRAEMERYPTPPAGMPKLKITGLPRFGRPHLWRENK